MKILVTGATGFVGQQLVPVLLQRGHAVTAVARQAERAKASPWFERVRFVAQDIHQPHDPAALFGEHDLAVHLAWPGLSDYRSLSHIERTLPADYLFLKSLVLAGMPRILVSGTCFEYGLQSGSLHEERDCRPATPYAIAKDSLHRFLIALQQVQPFTLQWARLFYMHGPGQKANSLLAQLDQAIDSRAGEFRMSGGEQLRDYLAVEEVAARIGTIAESPFFDGAVNVCSGIPISVRRQVEQHIARRKARIALRLGFFAYPDHEPMAFWGSNEKMKSLENYRQEQNDLANSHSCSRAARQ
jgi:nucleoside-diphosphate-sugar epimerase